MPGHRQKLSGSQGVLKAQMSLHTPKNLWRGHLVAGHLHGNHQNNLLTSSHQQLSSADAEQSNHRHLPCLDGERQSENSQSEEAAPSEHIGVKPTSHDTKGALENVFNTMPSPRRRGHHKANSGQSVKGETLHSHIPGHSRTSPSRFTFKGTQIMYCPCRGSISYLLRNQVQGFVTAGTFNFNSESSHATCKCSHIQKGTIRHSHKRAAGPHTVCTCYLSLPHPPTSLRFSVFLSLMF